MGAWAERTRAQLLGAANREAEARVSWQLTWCGQRAQAGRQRMQESSLSKHGSGVGGWQDPGRVQEGECMRACVTVLEGVGQWWVRVCRAVGPPGSREAGGP